MLLEIEDVDLMLTVVDMENKVYIIGRSRVEEIDAAAVLALAVRTSGRGVGDS